MHYTYIQTIPLTFFTKLIKHRRTINTLILPQWPISQFIKVKVSLTITTRQWSHGCNMAHQSKDRQLLELADCCCHLKVVWGLILIKLHQTSNTSIKSSIKLDPFFVLDDSFVKVVKHDIPDSFLMAISTALSVFCFAWETDKEKVLCSCCANNSEFCHSAKKNKSYSAGSLMEWQTMQENK